MRLISLSFALLFSCCDSKQTIKIKGSDTEVNVVVVLAEKFHSVKPQFLVSISGGGSGLGIAALLNGEADIANSSREINSTEEDLFRKRKMEIRTFVFAQDAIAFIVNKDNPVDTLTTHVLAHILNGAFRNWNSITGQNLPVNIYGRQSNSGTYSFLKRKLGIEFSSYATEMNGNAQIIEGVIRDVSGIGYVGAGYVANQHSPLLQKIKVLKIAGSVGSKAVSPLDAKAIKKGRYSFQRPLYQYVKEESLPKAKAFLDFERSAPGIQIIKAAGYYPATDLY